MPTKPLDEKAVRKIVKEELSVGLKSFYTTLIVPNFATKRDLEDLSEKFATKEEMNSKFNGVMNTLDDMHGLMKEMKQEMVVANNRVYKIQDPKIENHEQRITRLEASIA